jgi:hypothetical protein
VTLNICAVMNAYTLTDRPTWANFENRRALVILTEGDPRLFDPYGSILVNPAKWPLAKFGDAQSGTSGLHRRPVLTRSLLTRSTVSNFSFHRVRSPSQKKVRPRLMSAAWIASAFFIEVRRFLSTAVLRAYLWRRAMTMSVEAAAQALRPRGSGCYPDAPFDCLLYGGGFREITFFAHDTAASELGLGLRKRHYWNIVVFLSFGQPHHDSSLAARCVARDPAHL